MSERVIKTKAWAIVKPNGELALFDARCPVYWLRRIAESERREHGLTDHRVVRITVGASKE